MNGTCLMPGISLAFNRWPQSLERFPVEETGDNLPNSWSSGLEITQEKNQSKSQRPRKFKTSSLTWEQRQEFNNEKLYARLVLVPCRGDIHQMNSECKQYVCCRLVVHVPSRNYPNRSSSDKILASWRISAVRWPTRTLTHQAFCEWSDHKFARNLWNLVLFATPATQDAFEVNNFYRSSDTSDWVDEKLQYETLNKKRDGSKLSRTVGAIILDTCLCSFGSSTQG